MMIAITIMFGIMLIICIIALIIGIKDTNNHND